MPSETSSSSDNLSKPKRTPRLGLKPVLIAKPPLEADESSEVASGDGLVSTSSNDLPKALLDPAAADVETATFEENAGSTDSGMYKGCTW